LKLFPLKCIIVWYGIKSLKWHKILIAEGILQ